VLLAAVLVASATELIILARPVSAHAKIKVGWHPAHVRVGDVVWMEIRGVPESAVLEGSLGGRPLTFFPYAGGRAALVGVDVETKPGVQAWRVALMTPSDPPQTVERRLQVHQPDLPVPRPPPPQRHGEIQPGPQRAGATR